VLTGHWNIVFELVVLPSGHLASAAGDWSIKIWDTKTGTALRTIQYEMTKKFKLHLASLPSGVLVTGSEDFKENIELWDVETGKGVGKLSGHENIITALAAFPDGRVASASFDHVMKIWDVKSNSCIKTVELDASVHALATLPDGRLAYAPNEDNVVQVWDTSLEKQVGKLIGHVKDVRTFAIVDGHTIASGSDDQTVRVWDVKDYKPVTTLKGHESRVNSVVALLKESTGEGDTLASGSFDRTVKIWV